MHIEAMRSKKQLILDWLNGIDNVKSNDSPLYVTKAFQGALLEHL